MNKILTIKKTLCTVLLVMSISAISFAQPPGSGWGNPVFADEFNGSSVNTSIWRVRNEPASEFFSNMVSVSGGVLTISNNLTTNSAAQGKRGGWIDSKQLFGNGEAFPKYGYFEAEIRINLQGINFNWQGGKIWPTWWLWGGNYRNGGPAPSATELDIMEYSRWTNFKADGNASSSHHYFNQNVINGKKKFAVIDKNSPRDEFNWHRWGVLWTPTRITFYYDGVPFGTSDQPGDAAADNVPTKLIFSSSPHVQTHPDLVASGAPQVSDVLPSLQVRWVRVWQGGNPGGGSNPNPGGGSNPVVAFKKGNANFGLDGNVGGANGQNVYLWSYSQNNVNQQWVEIDRGSGFVSYKKRNTNFCLDGGNGGANGQNVYLWTCANNNQNQHWKKVDVGGGKVRLEKRNASGFSIDGGNGGSNGQNLYLWASSNSNANQHWTLANVGTSNRIGSDELEPLENGLTIYPNPTKGRTTFEVNLQEEGKVSLKIYDINGREVISLLDEVKSAGNHKVTWSPGDLIESLYIVKIQTPRFNQTSKLVLAQQ